MKIGQDLTELGALLCAPNFKQLPPPLLYIHFIQVKGTLPYQFDPDANNLAFSEVEKASILYSIAKFNMELDGCLRIV